MTYERGSSSDAEADPSFFRRNMNASYLPFETIVTTSDGHKQIQEVHSGDCVLDKNGRWCRVEGTRTISGGAGYKLTSYGFPSLTLGHEGMVYVMHKSFVRNPNNKSMMRVFGEPEWVPMSEIAASPKEWYLGSPIVHEPESLPEWDGVELSTGRGSTYVKQEIDVTSPGIWYLAGRYLGDGWLRKCYKKGDRKPYNGIVVSCGRHKTEDFERKLLLYKIPHTVAHERTADKYHFVSVELAYFMREFFGCMAGEKFISGRLFSLPRVLLQALVDGYVDTDSNEYHNEKDEVQIASINKGLLLDTIMCVERLYETPCRLKQVSKSRTCVIDGRTVNARASYAMLYDRNPSERKHAFVKDGIAWYPLKKAEEVQLCASFGLMVDGSDSYVATHCLVSAV